MTTQSRPRALRRLGPFPPAAGRVGALLLVLGTVLTTAVACTSGSNHKQPSPSASGPSVPVRSCSAAARATSPSATSGAIDVKSLGARDDGKGDDTAAFLRAQDCALKTAARFAKGPGGRPQAVVYVPAGTYRLLRLPFRSDVRMEVDAGAVLEQAGGRNVNANHVPSLIEWDGPPGHALKNVSLIGVGSATGGRKKLAEPLFPGWSVAGDFTFDLDPAVTDANVAVAGVQALNVDGFLIENVFSIENDSQPATAPKKKNDWFPQSRKAVLGLRGRSDTPKDGSVYYDPHNGTIANWYNVHAPKGFGPNQINAGHNLTFRHIFSRGGTSLRLETDASQGKGFGSELRDVHAEDIAGQSCNRAVAFVPHSQINVDVHVSHVRAVGCSEGVLESFDESNRKEPGRFEDSTISDVTVTAAGDAQNSRSNSGGLWQSGTSEKAFAKDPQTRRLWSITYSGAIRCTGQFSETSDRITTTSGTEVPRCG